MKRHSAFTLIELLIVVAIIAILAAIAVPNFLEAQIRSKVSRAQSDMRSLATGIECYRVDNNSYPLACMGKEWTIDTNHRVTNAKEPNTNVNFSALLLTGLSRTGDGNRVWSADCFGTLPGMSTLTTPVAYITSYPKDPFALKGLCYNYVNAMNAGWIMWSGGPDGDSLPTSSRTGTQISAGDNNGWALQLCNSTNYLAYWLPTLDGVDMPFYDVICAVYNPSVRNPQPTLVGYTYDTTNGTKSFGDIWRCKQ
ncbi:TPA: hypothetical protein DDW35_06500 [Candidatus Sumerlaeota bacterium]|jgi:prepilin-type N-terminal cleavage/methylation domain-containing protein|nr:hypothetical protein [Candidatus Sumerlaeota bacterium]